MQPKQSTHRHSLPTPRRPLPTRAAFTLTELLIVIAIIAVLASLIAAAAVNAWNNAKRNRVVLEIMNISGALENFKNDYGAYPPNGMNPGPVASPPPTNSLGARVRNDFARMFQKAFQRSQEPSVLIDAIAGITPPNSNVVKTGPLENGLTAAEAMCFWLGGFSDDEQYPITGPGGPSYALNDPSSPGGEVLESRNWRYEFDITRLGPRTDDGQFDSTNGRVLDYQIDLNGDNDTSDPGEQRRINFWRYSPQGSTQPLVYFDVSRYKPYQYDLWAAKSPGTPYIFALKQLRSGGVFPTDLASYQNNVVFVDQGKYQILHSGLDDTWGDDFERMSLNEPNGWGEAEFTGEKQLLLYPTGPFLGDIGDTLSSVADGTLDEASE